MLAAYVIPLFLLLQTLSVNVPKDEDDDEASSDQRLQRAGLQHHDLQRIWQLPELDREQQ